MVRDFPPSPILRNGSKKPGPSWDRVLIFLGICVLRIGLPSPITGIDDYRFTGIFDQRDTAIMDFAASGRSASSMETERTKSTLKVSLSAWSFFSVGVMS